MLRISAIAFLSTLTVVKSQCTSGSFSCGPVNAAGQGTVQQCVGGVQVHIDDCNDDPNNACTLINGLPFCVLGKGTIASSAAAPTTQSLTQAGQTTQTTVSAPTMSGSCAVNGAYACGPINAQGQGTVVQCVGNQYVKIDDCNDTPNNACQIIGGLPFCVMGMGVIASPTMSTNMCPSNIFYTVVSGDTCAQIATKRNVPLSSLIQYNPSCGSGLQIGTVLCIPTASSAVTTPTSATPSSSGTCMSGIFSCGPINAAGQGTVQQCVGGVQVHIDDCNDDPNNACTLINGLPFCVLGKGIIGQGSPTTIQATTTAVGAPTATIPTLAPSTGSCATNGMFACGPVNNQGQGTVVQCVGNSFVKIDDCNDNPNNACTLIGGNPFCVFGTGTIATAGVMNALPAPSTPPSGMISTSPTPANIRPSQTCTSGQFYCGPVNAMGQGTVVQCVGNALVHIDDCNDNPNNACQLIGGQPFCVLGSGIISSLDMMVQTVNSQSANSKMEIACTQGSHSCGVMNSQGFGTIMQCIGSAYIKKYACTNGNNNACQMFNNNTPYCVNGTGVLTSSKLDYPGAPTPAPSSGLGTDAYVGISVGVVVGIAVIVIIVVMVIRRRRYGPPTSRV